jgi:hypothetical protein
VLEPIKHFKYIDPIDTRVLPGEWLTTSPPHMPK